MSRGLEICITKLKFYQNSKFYHQKKFFLNYLDKSLRCLLNSGKLTFHCYPALLTFLILQNNENKKLFFSFCLFSRRRKSSIVKARIQFTKLTPSDKSRVNYLFIEKASSCAVLTTEEWVEQRLFSLRRNRNQKRFDESRRFNKESNHIIRRADRSDARRMEDYNVIRLWVRWDWLLEMLVGVVASLSGLILQWKDW